MAGSGGLVGSAVWRHLSARGFSHLIGPRSAELDLTDATATDAFFARHRPEIVIDAAARVGGILANKTYPVEFLTENLKIQVNLMESAARYGVDKLLFLGSSCIYPKLAPQPIREDSLLTGPLEETNIAYAIAKIVGVIGVQAHRTEYGRSWIAAMPTNLYGPYDNFHPDNSHVLPALIRRFDDASRTGANEVVLWGTGTPRRELLHVDDLAAACLVLLERYDDPRPINVGTGVDHSIREIAEMVAEEVGFRGEILLDTSKPDGTPRKLLDVSRMTALGWQPAISLQQGIRSTVRWYRDNVAAHG